MSLGAVSFSQPLSPSVRGTSEVMSSGQILERERLFDCVLRHSFGFLSPLDLERASDVNKRWRCIASEPSLWNAFDLTKVFPKIGDIRAFLKVLSQHGASISSRDKRTFIREVNRLCFPLWEGGARLALVSVPPKYFLRRVYWGLGEKNKWMEYIDGTFHRLGKDVFDQGLHGHTVEPGFAESMDSAVHFIDQSLFEKVNDVWYLRLHKHTCAHFNGDPRVFLMGQERVGVFRGDDEEQIHCTLAPPYYETTREGRDEFAALDLQIKKEVGSGCGLGEMIYDSPTSRTCINYKVMRRWQVQNVFNYFLYDFHIEIDQARTSDERLCAIAKLHQRLEWLHPVCDGTSRTNIALMNRHLTEYGFHPAILEFPHVSSCYGLRQWKQYLHKGLIAWERRQEYLQVYTIGL